MTWSEILLTLQAKADQKEQDIKESQYMIYNLAAMTAQFVNLNMNGKPIPDISKIFTDLQSETEEEKKEKEYKAMMLQRDSWMVFAERHNKRRKQSV